MAKYDAAIASPATSAGAFVVTTRPAMFYGVCCSGSANNTFINVHNKNTAGAKIFMMEAVATTVTHDGPFIGVICGDGIVATNIGTVTNYVVYYAEIAR
jgi:hypothetical protein